MSKTIVVAGYGPGISAAVAEKFGSEGFLGDPAAVHGMIEKVRAGGAGFVDPGVDAMMVQYGLMGLGVANAAKHKLVGLLAKKLEADGIYVGEIMISGSIKGTPFDQGQATIDAKTVAEKYWDLYTARKAIRATLK